MRRWSIAGGLALLSLAFGCHHEVEMVPLAERTIYTTDRFYDVQALTKDRAFVVGYGGKILETTNGGASWEARNSGTDLALYSVRFPDATHGYISGQDGLLLHTGDGGKTWEKQESNAVFQDPRDGSKQPLFLFAVYALDADHAWAVGDRSIITSTTDGGKTWRARKVAMEADLSGGESLAAADPIFYDVKFTDGKNGWIVGEFGKIMHTTDGGETWHEQEKSLLEGTGFFDLLDLPTLYGIHMSDPQRGVASGIEGHVARTSDGGQRWTYDEMQVDYPLIDPLFRIVELPNGDGWAVGAAGEVVRKMPGEGAWKRAQLGQDVLTWLRGLSFSDEKNGWLVGGFGLIYRTTDGGKTWLPSQG
ncbi:MAG TPA: YCF48-related protein [Candidatus Polarisedimenticolaceae bacterium]|nr:YCF48-related protein [Candidatus Polarisedimenticolaceae bacterium]